jgi:hypothetical protein
MDANGRRRASGLPVNGVDVVPLMQDELCAFATIIGPVFAVQTQKGLEISRAIRYRRVHRFRLQPMIAPWKRCASPSRSYDRITQKAFLSVSAREQATRFLDIA